MAGSSTAVAPSMAAPTRATQNRGHLHVVDAPAGSPKFSALPHEIIRDASLSRDARLLYAVLQMHWWQGTESYASHAEMAAEMGCSLSGIRRYLDELIGAGLIAEGLAGSRRAKIYIRLPIRQNDGIEEVVNTQEMTDCEPSNTSKPEGQSVKTGRVNRSKPTHSYKKTPVKKTPEEDLQPTAVDGDASAPPATAAMDQAQILRSLSAEAREILDWHRQCHGRRQPAKLNPESSRVLEEAVADLGVARLRESVSYMAGLIPAVPELSKAIRAARTKRSNDEQRAPAPARNGHYSGRPPTTAPAPSTETAAMNLEKF